MPAHVSTDVLTPNQLAFVAERLPEPLQAPTGRRLYSNLQLARQPRRDPDPEPGVPGETGFSGKYRAVGTELLLLVDRAGVPLASVSPRATITMALGFLTVANIYKPPAILRGILPDLVKASEPALLADKGYDSLRFRRFVQEHGFRPLIPTRRCIRSEQATGELCAEETVLQRTRYVVERTLGWLKSFRRLRYRVDRTRTSFQAFVYLAILVLCVRRLISTTSRGTSRQCANRPAWGWT